MSTATVYLKPKKDESIRRFHPWVFSGAIKQIDGQPANGDTVRVCANKGAVLGYGHYSPNATIAVRMVSFDEEIPDENFWIEKIRKAYQMREALGMTSDPKSNTYRLVHAEGDRLPGLIIDHFDGHLVIQTHSLGMHLLRDHWVSALKDIYGSNLKSIYDKSSSTLKKNGGYEMDNEYLFGDEKSGNISLENGHQFLIDWEGGQKTGFFIDQRENRELLGRVSKGKKILNTFCYTGGFSIYALGNGAELVHSLDSSQKALDLVEENVKLNGFDSSKHACIHADAVQFIKDAETDYDIIILDPPAFAKHMNARHKAVQGYKRINARAIEKIKPGGLIFTFSCSQAVDKQLFTHTIIAAAISVGREVKILHQLHQPADHPISAFHPEGEYLKGLVIQVN